MSTPSIISAIQKLRSLLIREEKSKWVGIVGFAICVSVLEVITATFIVVFAQVLNQPEVGQKYLSRLGFTTNLLPGSVIFYIAIACGVIYLFKNLVAAAEVFYQNFSIQKMNYNFKFRLLRRYSEIDYEYYLTRNSSFGMQAVGGDSEQIFTIGMVALANILSESIVLLFLVGMVIFMNPSLAFVIFALSGIIGLVLVKIMLPQFYRWGQRLQEAALQGLQNLLQFFHAFKEIILLGKKEKFINAYLLHSHKQTHIQAIQTATNSLPRMVIEVLFVSLFVATIIFLCLEEESPLHMVGILGGYLYAGFRIMPGLNRMINQLNNFKTTIPSIERVYNEYHTVAAKENYINVVDFHFEKSICLKKVSYRYLNTQQDALKNINLVIKKGECLGIVGETGSGKSTLVDVILGLLKPTEGAISIDDQYAVNSYQWHHKIGYVPQSIYLIDDTIEANITFCEKSEDIDENRLNQVIEDAQLNKFIKHLPKGGKTVVGERGIRLSGGERQRIAIARALYNNPEVLIFDEATSALDSETEARLMETIQIVRQTRTVIMVAHRLSTLQNCDRIVCMDSGNIEKITDYKNLQNIKLKNYA